MNYWEKAWHCSVANSMCAKVIAAISIVVLSMNIIVPKMATNDIVQLFFFCVVNYLIVYYLFVVTRAATRRVSTDSADTPGTPKRAARSTLKTIIEKGRIEYFAWPNKFVCRLLSAYVFICVSQGKWALVIRRLMKKCRLRARHARHAAVQLRHWLRRV